MFYTNVFLSRGKIHHRFIDKYGKPQYSKSVYAPYLYVPSNEISSDIHLTLVDKVPTKRIDFSTTYEAKDFIEKYKGVKGFNVYGNADWKSVFIADTYPEAIPFDSELIEIYTLDIETTCEDGFPDVAKAIEEITVLTVHIKSRDLKVCFINTKFGNDIELVDKTKLIMCKDETELLKKFISFWKIRYPDIVTGWNVDGFDIPFLVNRISNVLGRDQAQELSPWQSVREKSIKSRFDKEDLMYDIEGIDIIDYMRLYKKFITATQESYKLDHIAFVELGENKLDHSEYEQMHLFYKKDFRKYVKYNIQDVQLVVNLERKLKFLELLITIAYYARVNYSEVFSPVRVWESIIYNTLKKENTVVPVSITGKESTTYEGAYVKTPKRHVSGWGASFDAASMYPHIIMQWNISPETICTEKENVSIEDIIEGKKSLSHTDRIIAASGCTYKREKGILPRLMEQMYDLRKTYRKKMGELEKQYVATNDPATKVLMNQYHNFQLAIKILLNSCYGALGNSHFKYYNIDNAESITITGQMVLRYAEKSINDFMNGYMKTNNQDFVLYCDTDSEYVDLQQLVNTYETNDINEIIDRINSFAEKELSPALENSLEKLANYLHCDQNKMVFKRESIFNRAVWDTKKRYILNLLDNEGVRYPTPKVKITGMEAIRSSTPEIVKKAIKECYRIVLQEDETALRKYVEQFKEEFYKLKPEQIGIPKVSNGMSKYASSMNIYTGGTPINTRGSLLFNHYVKKLGLESIYPMITEGSRIKYVYLKMPNPIKENVIAFASSIPMEFGLSDSICYDTMWDKIFLSPVNSLLDIANWRVEEANNLEFLFG